MRAKGAATPVAIGPLKIEESGTPTLRSNPRPLVGDELVGLVRQVAHDLPSDRRSESSSQSVTGFLCSGAFHRCALVVICWLLLLGKSRSRDGFATKPRRCGRCATPAQCRVGEVAFVVPVPITQVPHSRPMGNHKL